jgi:hypothetical protein
MMMLQMMELVDPASSLLENTCGWARNVQETWGTHLLHGR